MPNIAGIIVKPIDFCYVTCVCISGELRAIYPCALSYPNAVPYSLIVYLRMYTCTCKSYIFKRDQKCGIFVLCILHGITIFKNYTQTNTHTHTQIHTHTHTHIPTHTDVHILILLIHILIQILIYLLIHVHILIQLIQILIQILIHILIQNSYTC